jgi:hypothetical protein
MAVEAVLGDAGRLRLFRIGIVADESPEQHAAAPDENSIARPRLDADLRNRFLLAFGHYDGARIS